VHRARHAVRAAYPPAGVPGLVARGMAAAHRGIAGGRRASPCLVSRTGAVYSASVRMSDTEAIMWAVEKDPALRSDFCNLTMLDRRPTDERLRATMDRALAAIPRLRQRVIGAPLRLVPPEFADAPTRAVDTHVRVVGVPPTA